jgi:hypothetical protein
VVNPGRVVVMCLLIMVGAGVACSGCTNGPTVAAGPNLTLGRLKVYGAPGYRFKVRFPGVMHCSPRPFDTRLCLTHPSALYSFLVEVSKFYAEPSRYRPSSPWANAHGESIAFGAIHGRSTGISCQESGKDQQCSASMLVSDGRTIWYLVASETFARVNTVPMKEFLASFRPLEG